MSTSPPAVTHLVGLYCKLRYKCRWIADFRDPLAENPFGAGFPERALEWLIARTADHLILNTDPSAAGFRRRYPSAAGRISVLPNGFDLEETIPEPDADGTARRTIVHVGDLYGQRHAGALFSSIRRLIEGKVVDCHNIALRLVGPIDESSPLHDDLDALYLSREGVLQYDGQLIPRGSALKAINSADGLLLLDVTAGAQALQVPAKIFDYLRTGRPVLAFTRQNSPTEEILSESGVKCVCVYLTDDSDELDRKVALFLQTDPTPIIPPSKFLDRYSGQTQTEQLAQLIERSRPTLAPQRSGFQAIVTNSAWMAIDRLFSIAASLLASVAVARMLGPSTLGHYNYALWLTNSVGSVALLGIPVATRKYMAEYFGKGRPDLALAVFRTTNKAQWAIAIAIVLAGLAALFYFRSSELFVVLAVISILPYMVMSLSTAAIASTERYAENVWASIVGTISNVIGIALSLFFGWGVVGLAAAYLASRSIDAILRRRLLRRVLSIAFPAYEGTRTPLPAVVRKSLGRFCVQATSLFLVNLVVWDRSEMLFLNAFSGKTEIAYYSLAFNITQQAFLVPQILSNAAAITLMVAAGRGPGESNVLTTNTVRYLWLSAAPLLFGLAAVSSPLLLQVYGEPYAKAIPVLAITAVATFPRAILVPMQQLFVSANKQTHLLACIAAVALVNIILDYALIPGFGALGAGWANGLAQVLGATATWFVTRRLFGLRLPGRWLLIVTVNAVLMALAVFAIARTLPGWIALMTCPTAGLVIYLHLLRFTGSLNSADRVALLSLGPRLPGLVRGWYLDLVLWLTAERHAQKDPVA